MINSILTLKHDIVLVHIIVLIVFPIKNWKMEFITFL